MSNPLHERGALLVAEEGRLAPHPNGVDLARIVAGFQRVAPVQIHAVRTAVYLRNTQENKVYQRAIDIGADILIERIEGLHRFRSDFSHVEALGHDWSPEQPATRAIKH